MNCSSESGSISKPAKDVSKISSRFFPLGMFLATILISGYFSTIGADARHDGTMFKPAMDVASGAMLFRDTLSGYGALVTLIQAVSLNIFGKYLIVLRVTTAFFYGLIAVLLCFILKRILPRRIVSFCLVAWIFFAPYYNYTFLPWSSVYALFFQLLGVWLLLLSFEKKSNRFVFLGGMSVALTFWCRQTVGAAMFLAVVAFFFYSFLLKQGDRIELRRNLLYFVAGNAVIHVFFFLWIAVNHAFDAWWKQNILFQYAWAKNIYQESPLRSLGGALFPGIFSGMSLDWIWAVLPVATVFVLLKNSKNQIIAFLSFVGLASWLQYYPVACMRHLYWGGTPMLGLLALLIYQFMQKLLIRPRRIPGIVIEYAVIIILLWIFLPNIWFRMKAGICKINTPYYFLQEPTVLKGMALTEGAASYYFKAYKQIEEYFGREPKGNVINIGPYPLVLTFDQRIKNFHPLWFWSDACEKVYPGYPDQLRRYIEKTKPWLMTKESL